MNFYDYFCSTYHSRFFVVYLLNFRLLVGATKKFTNFILVSLLCQSHRDLYTFYPMSLCTFYSL